MAGSQIRSVPPPYDPYFCSRYIHGLSCFVPAANVRGVLLEASRLTPLVCDFAVPRYDHILDFESLIVTLSVIDCSQQGHGMHVSVRPIPRPISAILTSQLPSGQTHGPMEDFPSP